MNGKSGFTLSNETNLNFSNVNVTGVNNIVTVTNPNVGLSLSNFGINGEKLTSGEIAAYMSGDYISNSRYVELVIAKQENLFNMDFMGLNLGDSTSERNTDYEYYILPVLCVLVTYLSIHISNWIFFNSKRRFIFYDWYYNLFLLNVKSLFLKKYLFFRFLVSILCLVLKYPIRYYFSKR